MDKDVKDTNATTEEIMFKYLELQETLKARDSEVETLKVFKEDFTAREKSYNAEITKLKESNMNLFLKVSQQPEQAPMTQDTVSTKTEPVKSWDEFLQGW